MSWLKTSCLLTAPAMPLGWLSKTPEVKMISAPTSSRHTTAASCNNNFYRPATIAAAAMLLENLSLLSETCTIARFACCKLFGFLSSLLFSRPFGLQTFGLQPYLDVDGNRLLRSVLSRFRLVLSHFRLRSC